MNPRVSIIMGSTSDLAIMEKAAKVLDDMGIPFEMNALSAHRTPAEVEAFAKQAAERGIEVIIAGAGMAAHLPGVIAAMTPVPVIGVPINASLNGMDALLAITSPVLSPCFIPVRKLTKPSPSGAVLLGGRKPKSGSSSSSIVVGLRVRKSQRRTPFASSR